MTSLADDRRDWAADVRAALDTLPAHQHRVLELSYGLSMSHDDIADQTGMPPAAVSGAIALAMRAFTRALQAADRRHARALSPPASATHRPRSSWLPALRGP